MALKPGSNAESPTADDAEEVTPLETAVENPDADTQPEVDASLEQQDAPPPDTEKVPDEPEAPAKPAAKPTPKASKPSKVDEAIAHLTTPPEADNAAKPAGKAGDTAKPTPKPGEQAAEAPAPLEGQPNDGADDALKDWSPEERKHTKGKVKERFRQLHARTTELETFAEPGRAWSEFVSQHDLGADLRVLPDEGMTVAIRTQAAALRVVQAAKAKQAIPEPDLRMLMANRDAIDQVLAIAGRPVAAPTEDHSKVEITQEVRDLKDAYGALKDEDEMRAVQAALNRHRGRKTEAAKRPAADEQRAPARTERERPAAPSVPWTEEDDRLARAGMSDDLVAAGVPRERADAHFTTNLAPLVAAKVSSLYPGKNPDAVWERLSPSNRRELVKEAQSVWAAKNPAKPTQPLARKTAPTPAPVQGSGGRPALMRSAGNGKGQTAAAVAYLSGEDSE
jgi:hypothetical protein